jgi:hypothetical protein
MYGWTRLLEALFLDSEMLHFQTQDSPLSLEHFSCGFSSQHSKDLKAKQACVGISIEKSIKVLSGFQKAGLSKGWQGCHLVYYLLKGALGRVHFISPH